MGAGKKVYLVGSASGIAAADSGCGEGPKVMEKSPYLAKLAAAGLNLTWKAMLTPSTDEPIPSAVLKHNQNLASVTAELTRQQQFFTVLGGDHSCAIGTWSGVKNALGDNNTLGLIWIDAHLDSHTQDTSPSGNIHGMPLACLLGHGDPSFISILGKAPKILPEQVCVIGVRSYESGEDELLKKLGVRVFKIDEVNQRGLNAVMEEALSIVTKGTTGFGVTLDIDSIDPSQAPGTGCREANGLHAESLCEALHCVANHPRLLGIEIVEFDPHVDQDHKTEKLIPQLMSAMILGK